MDINAALMAQRTNRYFLAINKPLEKKKKDSRKKKKKTVKGEMLGT